MTEKDAVALSLEELEKATAKFGPFSSAHEGWAIIQEEMDELWEEIKAKHATDEVRQTFLRNEAKQVAAMALRFLMDVC